MASIGTNNGTIWKSIMEANFIAELKLATAENKADFPRVKYLVEALRKLRVVTNVDMESRVINKDAKAIAARVLENGPYCVLDSVGKLGEILWHGKTPSVVLSELLNKIITYEEKEEKGKEPPTKKRRCEDEAISEIITIRCVKELEPYIDAITVGPEGGPALMLGLTKLRQDILVAS